MGTHSNMTTEETAAAAPAKKKFQPKKLSEEDALLKDIKIKTGICKRCTKELGMYKTENAKLQAVVDKLVEDGACSHDINKQKEVLEENVNIIPSTISRLQEAYENLFMLIVSAPWPTSIGRWRQGIDDDDVCIRRRRTKTTPRSTR